MNEESINLEFKEDISKTFLKTVSAFANYDGGKIVFGINNTGDVTGIDASDKNRLKIENMINDSITPRPDYNIDIIKEKNKTLIELNVREGIHKPYYYRNKTYKRYDTSTIEVDRFELNQLVLKGMNMSYEETNSKITKTTFNYLEKYLKNEANIEILTTDVLKTLKLLTKDEHPNIAGALLSDDNYLDNAAIDIVRFGRNINKILERETLSSHSILWQYDKTLKMFQKHYLYEEVVGFKRVQKELIPKEAFREALANAIVHRDWYLDSKIQISMYHNRIEIISPGGLPSNLTEEEYLNKNVSAPRNPILAGVFYRLNIIEQFGTGINRIKNEYKDHITSPSFSISTNYLKITLPIISDVITNLSKDEHKVYQLLEKHKELTRATLDELTGFNKSKTIRILNHLTNQYLIEKIGYGPGTRYRISN